MRRRRPLVAPASHRLPGESRREPEEGPRSRAEQGHRQAHPAALSRRAAAVAPRPAGERRRDPQPRRGLPDHDRRGVQAALLRGPRRAQAARHRDPLERGPALRDLVRALQPAGRRLLPRAGRAGRRRGRGPGRLPRRPRGPVRVLAAAPAGAAQPGAGAAGAAHRGRGAAAHRRARGARAGGRPAEAAGGRRRAQDGRVRLLRHHPRRGDRARRRPLRPAARRRRVVPRRLVPPARGPAHVPALAHPLAASSTTRGGRTTSRRPRTSTSTPTATGPPGSSPSRARRARVRVSPAMAWWVEAHWAHCGTVERLDDGGIVYETPYADARPLLGWVLGLADEAELLEPADLRARLREQLDRLAALLDAPAPGAAGAGVTVRRRAPAAPQGRPGPARRGRPLHAAHGAGQLPHAPLRRGRGRPRRRARCAPTSASPPRSCATTSACSTWSTSAATACCSGPSSRAAPSSSVSCEAAGPALARPARLSPLQADTLLLAIELVGHHLPTATGAALRERRREGRSAPAAARPRSPAATCCSRPTRSCATSTAPSSSAACSPSSTGPRAPTG